MLASPVTFGTYVGPSVDEVNSKRNPEAAFPLPFNETSAVEDRIYGGSEEGLHRITPTEESRIQDPSYVVLQYGEMLQEHVDKRVAIFCQQLTAAYGTRLHFDARGALDQADHSTTVYCVNTQGRRVKIESNQAAHCATLPCLCASYTPGSKQFVFLRGAFFYSSWQQTGDLPIWANQTDSLMDGKVEGEGLRGRALDIIRRAASGSVTPDQGLQEYIEGMLSRVGECRGVGGPRQQVLEQYGQRARQILGEIDRKGGYFDHLLGVKIRAGETDDMRRTVCELRYRDIRKNELAQAELARKIDHAADAILKKLGGRRPWYYKYAFRQLLVEQMRTEEDRRRLHIFFAMPGSYRDQVKRKGGFDNTVVKLRLHLNEITFLAREVSRDMYRMRTEEEQRRGDIMRKLRNARSWTQTALSLRMQRRFPEEPASQTTISRTERGERLVTEQLAQKLSAIYRTDPGLFMPAFFND